MRLKLRHLLLLSLVLLTTWSCCSSSSLQDEEITADLSLGQNQPHHRSKRTIREFMHMMRRVMRGMFGKGKKRGRGKGKGRPSSGYGAPKPSYGAPRPSYGAPSSGYGAPSSNFAAPRPTFGPQNRPQGGYGGGQSGGHGGGHGSGHGGGHGGGHGSGGYGGSGGFIGGGGSNIDNYGAPQAPVVGGNIDSYGSPQAPVVGGGGGGNIGSYGSPQAPVLGGGGGNINSYGSPQAPAGLGSSGFSSSGSSVSNYGSPQAPAIVGASVAPGQFTRGNSAPLSSYGSSSNVAFPSSSSSSSNVAFPSSNSYSSPSSNVHQMAPASLSNAVIKMLPAPNLATVSPISSSSGGSIIQSSYGNNNNFNSQSSVSSGFTPNNGPFQNSFGNAQNSVQAQDSYGSPQGSIIGNVNSNSVLPQSGQVVTQGNSFVGVGNVNSNTNFASNGNVVNSNAAPATDSYGIPQGSPITNSGNAIRNNNIASQGNIIANNAGVNGVNSGSAVFTNSNNQVVNANANPASDSYGIPQGNVISNSGSVASTINNNNNAGQGETSISGNVNNVSGGSVSSNNNQVVNANASPASDSYGIPQGDVVESPDDTGINPRSQLDSSGVSENASDSGTDTTSDNGDEPKDVYGSPVAPVGTSAPVPDDFINENNKNNQPTSFDSYGDDDTSDGQDAPTGTVVRTEIEGESDGEQREPIEIDLVNGVTVDLTNGLRNTDTDFDLTGTTTTRTTATTTTQTRTTTTTTTTTTVPYLFPGYEDIAYEYDPSLYDDVEIDTDPTDLNNINGLRASGGLPGYTGGSGNLRTNLGANNGRDRNQAYSNNEDPRRGKEVADNDLFEPAQYYYDDENGDDEFYEYTELDSQAVGKVPLKVDQDAKVSDGDPTVILVGTPEEERQTTESSDTVSKDESRTESVRQRTTLKPIVRTIIVSQNGGSQRIKSVSTTGGDDEEDLRKAANIRPRGGRVRNKKRVEDIPHEAFHQFLVEPPQGGKREKKSTDKEEIEEEKKRQSGGALDWSQRLRQRKRQQIWRQFGLNK